MKSKNKDLGWKNYYTKKINNKKFEVKVRGEAKPTFTFHFEIFNFGKDELHGTG